MRAGHQALPAAYNMNSYWRRCQKGAVDRGISRKLRNFLRSGDHTRRGKIEANVTLGGARMDTPTTYFHWGFILISMPNLLVIGGMIVLFAIALFAPFPHAEEGEDGKK
jgi:hypothetical protein